MSTQIRGHFAHIWTGEGFAPTTITDRLKFGPREIEQKKRDDVLSGLSRVLGRPAQVVGRSYDGVVRRWRGVKVEPEGELE